MSDFDPKRTWFDARDRVYELREKAVIDTAKRQSDICEQFGSAFNLPDLNQRVGIAISTLAQLPLNALRYPVESGSCGWYIWGGDLPEDPDFFDALCVRHVSDHVSALMPYLALAPGWRVLLAPGQMDVWYDKQLLPIDEGL